MNIQEEATVYSLKLKSRVSDLIDHIALANLKIQKMPTTPNGDEYFNKMFENRDYIIGMVVEALKDGIEKQKPIG